MRAKTKFYVEQLKVEIARLQILTSHNYHHIREIELELKYIQSLKKTRVKEVNILKVVCK